MEFERKYCGQFKINKIAIEIIECRNNISKLKVLTDIKIFDKN
jgi:hypothetical protein